MKKNTLSLLVTLLLVAPFGSAAIVSSMSDTFGDGDYATNTDGTGTGFTSITNGLGSVIYTETGGQVTTAFVGGDSTHGIISKDQIDTTGASSVQVAIDYASASVLTASGLEILVQQTQDFRAGSNDHDDLQIALRPGSVVIAQYDAISASATISGSYTNAELLDGFSVLITADAVGWTADFTGLGDLAISATFPGGAGQNFADIFTNAYVATHLQAGSVAATLVVNSVSFTAVPEPATMSLLALGGMAMLKRRKK